MIVISFTVGGGDSYPETLQDLVLLLFGVNWCLKCLLKSGCISEKNVNGHHAGFFL